MVITAAYRSLVKKYHPDTSGGGNTTADNFRLVQEAHATLGDPIQRKAYDELLAREARRAKAGEKENTSAKTNNTNRTSKKEKGNRKSQSVGSNPRKYAAAAITLLVVGVGFFLFYRDDPDRTLKTQIATSSASIPPDKTLAPMAVGASKENGFINSHGSSAQSVATKAPSGKLIYDRIVGQTEMSPDNASVGLAEPDASNTASPSIASVPIAPPRRNTHPTYEAVQRETAVDQAMIWLDLAIRFLKDRRPELQNDVLLREKVLAEKAQLQDKLEGSDSMDIVNSTRSLKYALEQVPSFADFNSPDSEKYQSGPIFTNSAKDNKEFYDRVLQ